MNISDIKTSLLAATGLANKDPKIRRTNVKSYTAIFLGILTGFVLHQYGEQLGHSFGHYWYATECPAELHTE